MDIRNFFGGGGSTKKKPDGTTSKKKNKLVKNTSITDKDESVGAVSDEQEKRSETILCSRIDDAKKKKGTRKRKTIVESDSDSDFEPQIQATPVDISDDDGIEVVRSECISTVTKLELKSEDIEEQFVENSSPDAKPKSLKTVNSKKSPAKKLKTATPKKKKEKKMLEFPKPTVSVSSYPDPSPGVFNDMTFVFTGVIDDLNREDGIDYIKTYGGRVTTAVSGKTNYLVVGSVLEDGRDIEEGSKYKKAATLGKVHVLQGSGDLYGLAKLLDTRIKEEQGDDGKKFPPSNEDGDIARIATEASAKSAPIVNPYAKSIGGTIVKNPYASSNGGTTIKNPYAKAAGGVITNPYAKKVANPYAKSSRSVQNSYAKKALVPPSESECNGVGSAVEQNVLWADKYAPNNTRMILGNRENVSKLTTWLARWEDTFNRPVKGKKRSFNPKTGPFKAALLSGPPGIGKTTTATLVANEAGRQVLELNASDARSKKKIEASLSDVTSSQVLAFGAPGRKEQAKKRVIIMDEVDGMGAGDRGGMAELIKMIKSSKVPIICICNDRQSQKIRSLVGHCLDLKYRRPVKSVIAKRAIQVGKSEGMDIEYNAAEAVAESCGNDIRQVLNCLQMWGNKIHHASDKVNMTYKAFKDRNNLIKKDELLRVTMFDATRMICEGRKGLADADQKTQLDSLFKRTDAYFTDYSLMGLLVHQNYLKVGIRPFQQTKLKGDEQAEHESLVNLYRGTEAMSDFALAEDGARSGQNWGLLPFCSVLAVKSGYHVGGEGGGLLPGFPEFSGWLGKNSSRGKRDRLLQELGHHMNYRISADKSELRLGYLPVIRDRIADFLITKSGEARVKEAIEFMDEYGLDRDDVFENIDEFNMDQSKKFADIESKAKASFTREYNKGVHKSQALIEEQGLQIRKRKKDNDEDAQELSDDDNEMTEEEVKKMFRSSTKGKKKAKATNAKKSSKK